MNNDISFNVITADEIYKSKKNYIELNYSNIIKEESDNVYKENKLITKGTPFIEYSNFYIKKNKTINYNKKAILLFLMTGIAGIGNVKTSIKSEVSDKNSFKSEILENPKNLDKLEKIVISKNTNSYNFSNNKKEFNDYSDLKQETEILENSESPKKLEEIVISKNTNDYNISNNKKEFNDYSDLKQETDRKNNKIKFTFNGMYYNRLNSHKENNNSLNSSNGTTTSTTIGQSYATITTTENFNVTETQLRQSTILMSFNTPEINVGDDAYWDTIVSLGGQKIPYVVINPFNGPANAVDPRYVAQIDRNLNAGIKNIAYVYTDRMTRAYQELFSDIDKYVQFYGQNKIAGIFLDELVAGRSNAANNTYMQTAYNYIKNNYPHMIVVGNAAAPINDDLAPYADIWLTSEVTANEYINNYKSPTSVFENDTANFNRIMHVVHTANPTEYEKILELSRQRNAGWIMITSDVQWNPYNDLPLNFEDIQTKINTPVVLQKVISPNGTVTTQTVTPGGIVTTTTTTNNGVGQLEMPRSKLNLDLTRNTRFVAYKNIQNNKEDKINIDLTYIGNFSTDYSDKKSSIEYTSKSNGMILTTSKKIDKLVVGSTFGYQNSKVDYKGKFDPIKEKINSFQFTISGKYDFNENIDLMSALTYSTNKHKFKTETGLGTMHDVKYNSQILNFDTRIGYKFPFEKYNFNGYIKPYVGLGVTRVNEGKIDKLNIGKALKTDLSRIMGVYSQISMGKVDIYGNIEYEDRKNNASYHSKRSYSNSYEIAPLHYSKGSLNTEIGIDYKISDLFKIGLGYNLNNSKNSNITLGFQASF